MANSTSGPRCFVRFGLLVCAGVAITLTTGLLHGRLTQRWGAAPNLKDAASQLKALPSEIGDWRLLEESPIEERVLQMLSCAGYINRQYVNRISGQTVSIAIIVGPPGPTSVHTPEICYSSRTHSIQTPRQQLTLPDRDGRVHSFWSLSFQSQNPLADQLSVCYAWTADGVWVASEAPRFKFAAKPLLYKIQLACSMLPNAESQDPCKEFLSAFLGANWKIDNSDSEGRAKRNTTT